MMRVRATACLLLASVFGCATGIEPTLEQQSVEAGGSNPDNGGSAGTAVVGGSAGTAVVGGSAGSGGVGTAGTDTAAGRAGGGASSGGASAGTGGSGGAGGAGMGGTAGAAGNGGAGGTPSTVKPTALSVGATKNNTAKQAPSAGGTVYDDACPAGQVLIGFNGSVGSDQTYLRSVEGVCATLALQATAPFAITTSQAGTLPVRMTAKATAQSALCPANQVVVGFAGTSGGYVDSLKFKCAPLSVTGQAPDYKLNIGTATDTGSIGGPGGGSAFNAILCASGQVAVSQRPNAFDAVDGFGLACADVTLIVK